MPAKNARSMLVVLLILALAAPSLAARPAADKLVPDSTVVYVCVPNVPELSKRFLNTAIGRMAQDPQVQPFLKHLYGSMTDFVAKYQDRIGLGLNDILALPQGELALAVVPQESGPPALILFLDAGSQLSNALTLVQKGSENLEKMGAKKSEQTIEGTKVTVFEALGRRERTVAWFEKDGTIVAASSIDAIKGVLGLWGGQSTSGSLAQSSKYTAILARCQSKEDPAQAYLYIDPIALIRAVGQGQPAAQLAIALFPTLGLDGLMAAGASLTFDTGHFDSIFHGYLMLENPRGGVFDILAFKSGDTKPEPWVPSDTATYVTLYFDFDRGFRNFEKLYDSIRGEGSLAGEMERANQSLGVDIAKEILPQLAGRATLVTRFEGVSASMSPSNTLALKLKNVDEAAKLLERIYEKNQQGLTTSSAGQNKFYQVQSGGTPQPDAPPRPTPTFGIIGDYFVVTDRMESYQKVLQAASEPGEPLSERLDYKLIASRIQRLANGKKPSLVRFDRPEVGFRRLHELAMSEAGRERLKKEAERNPLAKTLLDALEANPLPPFAVFEQYLAPTGGMLIDDETGLHYTVFSLKRK